VDQTLSFCRVVERTDAVSPPQRSERADGIGVDDVDRERMTEVVVVVVAAVILGVFTSISDFSLYQVVDLFTSMVS
jgi:hypothetical protein